LAKRDEFSSTEKLLELIRDNSSEDADVADSPPPSPSFVNRFSSILKKGLTPGKSATVGVDIGYNDLKLVKVRNVSSENVELVDYKRIPFERDISTEHPDFADFLKTSLSSFCGSLEKPDIWANISSAKVDLRYLKIPKVPQKQIANAVYWTHKRVASFNEAEIILDYEILEEIVEGGTPKIVVVSYTTPQQQVQRIKSLFYRTGFPLTGISTVPFSFQNLIRSGWISTTQDTLSSLYIGRDWSRIDIFSGGNLVLSRGIKAGIKTLSGAISGETVEPEEMNGDIELPPDFFETPEGTKSEVHAAPLDIDSQKAQQIFFGLIHDTSAEGETQTALQPEEEKVFKTILPALKRLVQQVQRTFEHYTTHIINDPIKKIYISSNIRPHRRIVNYIGDELGILRDTYDPFATDPQHVSAVAVPKTISERESYTPAIGMALSTNSITPNVLYTHEAKTNAARSRLWNKVSMFIFAILLAASFGFNWWQSQILENKKAVLRGLDGQFRSYKAPVDQNAILKLVEKSKKQKRGLQEFGNRFHSVAVLAEISNLTPSNVRLITISSRLNANPGEKESNTPKNLVLEGIILGERTTMEAVLAAYLLSLSDSPVFRRPIIKEKELGYFYDNEVLRFTAQLDLI
jgi:Tfp pilus assembly PilM family ATPase